MLPQVCALEHVRLVCAARCCVILCPTPRPPHRSRHCRSRTTAQSSSNNSIVDMSAPCVCKRALTGNQGLLVPQAPTPRSPEDLLGGLYAGHHLPRCSSTHQACSQVDVGAVIVSSTLQVDGDTHATVRRQTISMVA